MVSDAASRRWRMAVSKILKPSRSFRRAVGLDKNARHLYPSEQDQDDDDDQNERQSAAGKIAPSSAMGPVRHDAQEQNDQQGDDEYSHS